MKIIIDDQYCTGCGACSVSCPTKAIHMEADKHGFLHPMINQEICINCRKCTYTCPVLNDNKDEDNSILAYAARSNNAEMRNRSSSGAVFPEIANWFWNRAELLQEQHMMQSFM